MDLVRKIYESEYFVIILFSVISVLTFLFILVAILGKKDKKNVEINGNEVKNESNVAFSEVNSEPEKLEVTPDIQPVETLDTFNNIDNGAKSFTDINIGEQPVPMVESLNTTADNVTFGEPNINLNDFSFDAPTMDANVSEVNSVETDNILEPVEITDNQVVEEPLNTVEPVVIESNVFDQPLSTDALTNFAFAEEPIVPTPDVFNTEVVEPKAPEPEVSNIFVATERDNQNRVSIPNQFSSVFVNHPEEPVQSNEPVVTQSEPELTFDSFEAPITDNISFDEPIFNPVTEDNGPIIPNDITPLEETVTTFESVVEGPVFENPTIEIPVVSENTIELPKEVELPKPAIETPSNSNPFPTIETESYNINN